MCSITVCLLSKKQEVIDDIEAASDEEMEDDINHLLEFYDDNVFTDTDIDITVYNILAVLCKMVASLIFLLIYVLVLCDNVKTTSVLSLKSI